VRIDQEKCQTCADCIPFCPVGAIEVKEKKVTIESDACVECGVCARSGVCQDGAFIKEDLPWPRILRAEFSDPMVPHKKTDIAGRGTAWFPSTWSSRWSRRFGGGRRPWRRRPRPSPGPASAGW
jgi:uncharacterized Fe-S center protein